jgi:hypothetical protein
LVRQNISLVSVMISRGLTLTTSAESDNAPDLAFGTGKSIIDLLAGYSALFSTFKIPLTVTRFLLCVYSRFCVIISFRRPRVKMFFVMLSNPGLSRNQIKTQGHNGYFFPRIKVHYNAEATLSQFIVLPPSQIPISRIFGIIRRAVEGIIVRPPKIEILNSLLFSNSNFLYFQCVLE